MSSLSSEHKKKIGGSIKGRKYPNRKSPPPFSEEHRRKLRQARKNITFSEETRSRISCANKGRKKPDDFRQKISILKKELFENKINHPRWIEDRSKIKKSEKKYLNPQYIYWSREVKERDNWKCKINNSDCNGRLESHHILNWVDYPELRYELNNGITLCHSHHPRGREKEKRMVSYFVELLSVSKE